MAKLIRRTLIGLGVITALIVGYNKWDNSKQEQESKNDSRAKKIEYPVQKKNSIDSTLLKNKKDSVYGLISLKDSANNIETKVQEYEKISSKNINVNYTKNHRHSNHNSKSKYSQKSNNISYRDTIFVTKYITKEEPKKNMSLNPNYSTGNTYVDIAIRDYLNAGRVKPAAHVAIKAKRPDIAIKIYEDYKFYNSAARTAKKEAVKTGEIQRKHGRYKFD